MEIQVFDLIEFDLFGIDLNTIDINTDSSVDVKESYIPTTQSPYIKGHVTDGASTFTFKVNNQDMIVPVGADGWWKWKVDRSITSLKDAFRDAYNLNIIEISLKNISVSCENIFRKTGSSANLKVKIRGLYPTNADYIFYKRNVNELDVPNDFFKNVTSIQFSCLNVENVDFSQTNFTNGTLIFYEASGRVKTVKYGVIKSDVSYSYLIGTKTENVEFAEINKSLTLNQSKYLTEQSVVNIFNAINADGLSIKFHADVGAMIDEQLEIEDSPIYTAYWAKYDEGIEINYTY